MWLLAVKLSPIPRAFSLQHNNIPEIFLVLVSQLLKISSRMFHTIKTLKSQTISLMISAMCDFLFLSLSSTVQHCKIFTNERGWFGKGIQSIIILGGVYMGKLAPAWVSYRDDFLISYRVYRLMSHFISLLYEGTFHVDKIQEQAKIADIMHALPIPVYWQTDFTPKQVFASCSQHTVAKFHTLALVQQPG